MNGMPKRFVYILRSLQDGKRPYVGLTSNVSARLAAHNDGHCTHTVRHRPWRVILCIEFEDEKRAVQFEKYLKSGSGWAFSRRHFL
jgi:putative endonuclease